MNPQILDALGGIAVGAVFFAGVGCSLAVVRVVLPALAGAADRSLAGLGTARIVVSGVLPLVGSALLLWAISAGGLPHPTALVVWIPLLLLAVAGAVAAVPHLGARLLRGGDGASLLARSVTGGLATGLAMATWAIPALGVLVSLVLLGWLVGIGIGLFFRPPAA